MRGPIDADDLLEAQLRARRGVLVRVELDGEPPIGPAQGRRLDVASAAQDAVKVGPVVHRSRSSYTAGRIACRSLNLNMVELGASHGTPEPRGAICCLLGAASSTALAYGRLGAASSTRGAR